MKILLIAGHGQGDPGASGFGIESEKTRELVNLLRSALTPYARVDVYNQALDAYQQSKDGHPPTWNKYDYVFEVHFNSYKETSANGSECWVHPSESGTTVEEAILSNMKALGFTNRGVRRRSDLLNMNLCREAGISYCLFETCFISNKRDMDIYEVNKIQIANAVTMGIVSEFGLESSFKPETESSTIYYVQTGAFKNRDNAEAQVTKLKSAGFDAFIKTN